MPPEVMHRREGGEVRGPGHMFHGVFIGTMATCISVSIAVVGVQPAYRLAWHTPHGGNAGAVGGGGGEVWGSSIPPPGVLKWVPGSGAKGAENNFIMFFSKAEIFSK